MNKLQKLNEAKKDFIELKERLLEDYISEIGLNEMTVTPMSPVELEQNAKKYGQVVYLPPGGFIHDERSPRDRPYIISDFKFFHKKAGQNTEMLMDQIEKEDYVPFDIDMTVNLLKLYPNIIEFFNLTTSSYTDGTIVREGTSMSRDNKKYWLSAYFGNFVNGKIKWRRDQDDYDENFIIPTYKTIKFSDM